MDFIHRFIKRQLPPASRPLEASRSFLLTRAHGLHGLILCKSCQIMNLEELADSKPHPHLGNCFDLIKTSEICRLCAYISHIVRGGMSSSLERLLVAYDILPESNVPLCIVFKDCHLEFHLGEWACIAKVEIFGRLGRANQFPLSSLR